MCRRFRRDTGQRILQGQMVEPVGDAERLFLRRFVARLCGLADQRLFALRERADIFVPALDRGLVAIGGDERLERLHQPPRGRVDHRFEARMDVALWRSEEHTSELQSLMRISYAVFCLT